jgi:hypothetical protein
MSMQVASYFSLKNKTQNELNIWLRSLPINLRGGHYELLWRKSQGKKSVIWTSYEGFQFF